MSGPAVAEIFEVLDGPEFAAGEGKISLSALEHAISCCPPVEEQAGDNDPIGSVLATLIDSTCVLQSLSFRVCALGRLELKPLSAALAACPWNLRILNLWDNR